MRKKLGLLAASLMLVGLLTGCTTPERTTLTKNCTPPPAETTTNNIVQGGSVTVYNTGADCGVRFTTNNRQITVTLKSTVGSKRIYASKTLTAGTDGQYQVRLQVPASMPVGAATVGITSGVKVSCDTSGSCPSLLKRITVLTANGFPQASFEAQQSASPKP